MAQPYPLDIACLSLRNAAPAEWQNFIEKFDAYTLAVTVAVTEQDASEIMTMKGRALQCRALLKMFYECDKHKDATPPLADPQPVRA